MQRDDFQYVLCLDVSRWGRFQDIDLSAQHSAECKRNGKLVVYTTIGMLPIAGTAGLTGSETRFDRGGNRPAPHHLNCRD